MRSLAQAKVPLVSLVLVFSLVAYGHQVSPFPILPNSSVFVDPMDGFGPELQKAFLKERVPLAIVSDRSTAEFEIRGGRTEQQADAYEPQPRFVAVSIVSLKTGVLAWGYGMSGMTDLGAAADSCAKELKDKIKRGLHEHPDHD